MSTSIQKDQFSHLGGGSSYLQNLSSGVDASSLTIPPQYKNLQEWKFYDESGYLAAVDALKQQESDANKKDYWLTGDTYVPIVSETTDFLGSALWGAIEGVSFGAGTVADIASDGAMSDKFGWKEWEQETWASKAGYVTTSLATSLMGLGLIGKGIKGAAAVGKVGSKVMAREGAELLARQTDDVLKGVTGSGMTDDMATNIFKVADDAIKEGTDDVLQEATGYFNRSKLKTNPFGDFDLQQDILKRTRDNLKTTLDDVVKAGDEGAEWAAKVAGNDEAVNAIVKEALETSQKYGTLSAGQFNRSLAVKLGNTKFASYVGDAAYESMLLGVHSGAHTLISNFSADAMDLDDDEYHRRSWMKDSLMGAVTGLFFPAVRRIGGGKDVQVGMNGMVPSFHSGALKDVNTFFKSFYRKLAGAPKVAYNSKLGTFSADSKLSPKQVQTMLRNVYEASGKSSSIFGNVAGFNITMLRDPAAINNKTTLKILAKAYESVNKKAMQLAGPMMKEIGKDLWKSMPRMLAGTMVMNAHGFYENWDHYPPDRMAVDVLTGMMFMKRKHVKPGSEITKYFGSGEFTGAELAKFSKSLDILGYDKKTLDYFGGVYNALDVDEQVAKTLNDKANSSSKERRDLKSMVDKDTMDAVAYEQEFKNRTANAEDVKTYREHGALEYVEKLNIAKKLRDQGKIEEARALEVEAKDGLAKWDVVNRLVESMNLDISKQTIKPMTREESLAFIEKLSKLQWKGKEITHENVDQFLRESRIAGVNEVTSDVQQLVENYIKNSMQALGMWNDAMVQKNGIINVHEDIFTILDQVNKNPQHAKATEVLKAVLQLADRINIINLGKEGVQYKSSGRENPLTTEVMENLSKEYNAHTDLLHEKVFGDGQSHWREIVPGKTKEGFLDENILASIPIFHALQTNQLHMRNAVGYDLVTGKNLTGMKDNTLGSLHDKMDKEFYKGKGEVVITDVPTGGDISGVQQVVNFVTNYNSMKKLTTRGSGKTEVTFEQAQQMYSEVRKEVGELFSNHDHFRAFKDYAYEQYLTDVIGDNNVGRSLRRAVSMLLDKDNPLAVRNDHNGTTTLPSHVSLEKVLLGNLTHRPGMTTEQVQDIRSLIEAYRVNVENVLKDKGNIIKFSDDLVLSEASIYTRQDWQQHLSKVITQVESDKLFRMGHVIKTVDQISRLVKSDIWSDKGHFERLVEVATNKKDVKELQEDFLNLKRSTLALVELIHNGAQYQDVVLLRSMVDRQFDIQRALDNVNQYTVRSKSFPVDTSLGKLSLEIDNITKKIIKDRNEKLSLDDHSTVEDFIIRQSEKGSYTDGSGKRVNERQTMSDNVFQTKYEVNEVFLDLIKGNIRDSYDNFDKLSNLVKSKLNTPGLKDLPNYIKEDILNNLRDAGITEVEYVDQIIKPQLDYHWEAIKNHKLVKDSNITYADFVTDALQLIQSGIGQRKVQIATYKGVGSMDLNTTAVSNWNKGFNALIDAFGFDASPGSFILVGKTNASGARITSRLDRNTMQAIRNDLNNGVTPKFKVSDIITAKEQDELNALLRNHVGVGDGQGGKSQYGLITLDEKTMVMISHNKYADIVNTLKNKNSSVYSRFIDVLGPKSADAFIADVLKINDLNVKDKSSPMNNGVIEQVLKATRLAYDRPDVLRDWARGGVEPNNLPKVFKYFGLSNPRNGMPMSDRVMSMADAYVSKMFVNDPQLTYLKAKWFEQRKQKKHRKLVIFDEKDPSGDTGFFSAYQRHKDRLERQLIEDFGFSPKDAKQRALDIAEQTKSESKSVVDAEVYLNKNEMIAMLISRGAHKDWFVWEGNRVVGFNVSIKPTVSHSEVTKTGGMTVVLDKTAFKYDPMMDAAMKDSAGNYFTESIAFKSAVKVGKRSQGWNMESTDIGIGVKLDITGELIGGRVADWKDVITTGIRRSSKSIFDPGLVEIDRNNILLKSISGPHKGTVSVAFGNFLSNDAQMVLDNWLGSTIAIHDLTRVLGSIKENPYALHNVAKEFMTTERQSGDLGSRLSGLEYIINNNGLPTYEFMRPQIEKAITSNYMNSRNFMSGEVPYGGYNVMTAGSGLSDPLRFNGTQHSFGGSGVPHYVAKQNISQLLTRGGVDGVPLIFKLSKTKAQELNRELLDRLAAKGVEFDVMGQEFFAMGEEMLVMHAGNGIDVTGPIYGKLNRLISEQPLGQKHRNVIKNVTREILQEVFEKDFSSIMKEAISKLPTETTYGDFVKFLDLGDASIKMVDQGLEHRSLHREGYVAKSLGYDGVYTAALDLRTPKDGINSWVISKVEKLLDKRRGAVSEMNATDAINPQDADFDLDKSTQFTSVPSKIMNEIYGGSGYHERSSHQILEKAGIELKLENSRKYEAYIDELNTLDSKRAPIVRQHSVAAFIMQYFSSISENRAYNTLKPGYRTGVDFTDGVSRVSSNIFDTNIIGDFKGSNDQLYRVSFREGGEFVDSVQAMKSVIKEMIDVYSDPKSLNGRNVQDFFWFHEKVGLFKLTKKNRDGQYEEITWDGEVVRDVSNVRENLGKHVLKPLNDIFNLANGTETLSDGTQRKMTVYDYVKTFESAKYAISRLKTHKEWINGEEVTITPVRDRNKNPILEVFADRVLKFLGDGWSQANGTSNHPLIKGLNELSHSINSQFQGKQIYRNDLLANILESSTHPSNEAISRALKSYIKDESSWVTLSSLRWEMNRISDIMNDLTVKRQDKTTTYTKLDKKHKKLSAIIAEAEKEFNNTFIGRMIPKRNNGSFMARTHTRVYKLDANKKVIETYDYKKGEYVKYFKGNVVNENPRRFVISDNLDQTHRRAMYRAFATNVKGISSFDAFHEHGFVKQLQLEFFKQVGSIEKNANDQQIHDSRYHSDLNDMSLSVFRDIFSKAKQRGDSYAEQLLYNMLTPKVSRNIASIMNYDTHADSYFSSFYFNTNAKMERMVISFLSRAMEGKVAELSKGDARELFKRIEKRRNVSTVREWDKTLDGEAFRTLDVDFSRRIEDFQVIPTQESAPHWTKAEVKNEAARLMLQKYVTGSYRLDPIELYRLTAGLDKTLNTKIDVNTISESVRGYWTDISDIDLGKGHLSLGRRSLREKIATNRENTKTGKGSEYIENLGCGL